uniref:Uncharacterized protein n=1 Tax=Acrobeloides nanus TaxID=290746 RepID=A0A914D689_9BILA
MEMSFELDKSNTTFTSDDELLLDFDENEKSDGVKEAPISTQNETNGAAVSAFQQRIDELSKKVGFQPEGTAPQPSEPEHVKHRAEEELNKEFT